MRYLLLLTLWIISAIVTIILLHNIDQIVHGDLYNFGLQFSNDWAEPYWIYLRLNYIILGFPIALSILSIAILMITKKQNVRQEIIEQQPELKYKQQSTIDPTPMKHQTRLTLAPSSGIKSQIISKYQSKSASTRSNLSFEEGRKTEKQQCKSVFETDPQIKPMLKGSLKNLINHENSINKEIQTKVTEPEEKVHSKIMSCPKCCKTFSKPLCMLDFGNGKTILVNLCPYCNYVLGSVEHIESVESKIFKPKT